MLQYESSDSHHFYQHMNVKAVQWLVAYVRRFSTLRSAVADVFQGQVMTPQFLLEVSQQWNFADGFDFPQYICGFDIEHKIYFTSENIPESPYTLLEEVEEHPEVRDISFTYFSSLPNLTVSQSQYSNSESKLRNLDREETGEVFWSVDTRLMGT